MPTPTKKPSVEVPVVDLKTILTMLNDLKRGDFSTRVPEGLTGLQGKVADSLNDLSEMNEIVAAEISSMRKQLEAVVHVKKLPAPVVVADGLQALTVSTRSLTSWLSTRMGLSLLLAPLPKVI